jgi:hypothetical protein
LQQKIQKEFNSQPTENSKRKFVSEILDITDDDTTQSDFQIQHSETSFVPQMDEKEDPFACVQTVKAVEESDMVFSEKSDSDNEKITQECEQPREQKYDAIDVKNSNQINPKNFDNITEQFLDQLVEQQLDQSIGNKTDLWKEAKTHLHFVKLKEEESNLPKDPISNIPKELELSLARDQKNDQTLIHTSYEKASQSTTNHKEKIKDHGENAEAGEEEEAGRPRFMTSEDLLAYEQKV